MTQTNNTDAHMPPQAEEATDPVWGNTWNPETNEWAPSSEQHSVFGVAEPGHGDLLTADPMSDNQADPRTFPPDNAGSIPDARMNLRDSVRHGAHPYQLPTQRVEHVMYTEEVASALVRGRLVAVVGNATPTVLLEENPQRVRALIKVFTAGSTILVYPARQGGIPQLVAAPATAGAFYPQSTGDPVMTIESQASVECVGTTAGGVLVAVWEELTAKAPGLV